MIRASTLQDVRTSHKLRRTKERMQVSVLGMRGRYNQGVRAERECLLKLVRL